ncbi:hypothetical protein [Aureispira anguillae]|uniref:Uncharacterized protein n=1 Tax=Aureispira anguillae TaxID=2864201 RepID=A0A915YM03_9BACT|nr:hypothetical protein [Aureispira anguillae]BDS15674.1 hypothetical protein AsAng_0064580 [Aureispira anguillae]
MKLKYAGFYKEEGYPNTPSIYDFLSNKNALKRKMPWKIRFYLMHSPVIVYTTGKSILDGTYFRLDGWSTDGKWIWKTGIVYYYENHGIDLPIEFEKYLKSKWLPYPILFGPCNFLLRNKLVEKVDTIFTNYMEQGIPPRE